MSRFALLAIIAGLLYVGCAASQPAPARARTQSPESSVASASAVDSVLGDVRQRHNMPAMAVAIVRGDTVLEVSVVGVRRQGQPARVVEGDAFHIGSNTKAMTATVIAMLVQKGALGWTTTVSDAFPGYGDSIETAYRTVTLKELLAHRAGVPPFTAGAEFEHLPRFDGPPEEQREAFAKWLLRREPEYEPGTKFSYSNAGYAVAAAMAEKVTGMPWEEMLRALLFRPLGITGRFGWPAAADSTQPWGHWTEESGTLQPHDPRGPYRLETFVAPAGDVSLSIGDYAEFLQLHLRGLQGKETELLDPSAFRYMHDPDLATGDSTGGSGYALGWAVQQLRGTRTSTHAGSAGTFYALAAVQPSRDLAVAVFTNAGNKEAEAASTEALLALLEQYGEAQP